MRRVDLSGEVRSICAKLELDPEVVRELVLTPHTADVQVFLRNEHGRKFIRGDGNVAIERLRIPIKTT